jgi:hypothetical protein
VNIDKGKEEEKRRLQVTARDDRAAYWYGAGRFVVGVTKYPNVSEL